MGLIRALVALILLAGAAHAGPFFRGASGGTVAPTWATDQTQQMPYVCSSYVWINPSASAYGGSGGGSLSPAQGGTGTGTQAHPFLTLTAMYSGNGGTHISSGTCVNIENSTPLVDDPFNATSLTTGYQGGSSNSPTGYAVLRSTDGNGNLVAAAGAGVTPATVNSSAAHLILSACSGCVGYSGNVYFLRFISPSDFWIIDGLNIEGVGSMTTNDFYGCVTVGDGGLNYYNNPQAPTHFQVRNSYIHGCGGAGVQTLDGDWMTIQNNVIIDTSGSPGYQESGIGVVASMAGCTTYFLNCPPIVTGYDATIGTLLNGHLIPYHNVITGNWVDSHYEFGQAGQHSDGNCIIIDTNTISQNGSVPTGQNAAPYQYRTLIANNVIVHCGGHGIHAFFSQHVDAINNTAEATNFDPNQSVAARQDLDCFSANDCSMVNNAAYTTGGVTPVRVAYTAGSVGPVSVDNVLPFLYSWTGGQPTGGTPMPVTMQDTTSNGIVAVTIDGTNLSATPGGVSGTLTFSGVISTLNGAMSALITPQGYNINSYASSFAYYYSGFDAQPNANIATCQSWAQVIPLPCSGGTVLLTDIAGTLDTWQYNNWYGINGATGATIANGPPLVSPTVAGSPGYNAQATNPLLTTTAFATMPDFIMATLPTLSAAGSGYTVGCIATLAGGSPITAASIKVDTLSGSGIANYHLYAVGHYPAQSTTSFTQTSATCVGTGASFAGATFFRPFWMTSRPTLTLQGGSPLKNAGSPAYCLSQDFTGAARPCPSSIGAYE